MRGEFRFANGLILPNNVMKTGRAALLSMALRGNDSVPLAGGGNFYVGLCNTIPSDEVSYASLEEPTIGSGGYSRMAVTRDSVGFPTTGEDNGEPYIESKPLIFVPTGAGFDKAITRCFIGLEATALLGNIYSLSAPLPAALTLLPSTAEEFRTFTYRLYMR